MYVDKAATEKSTDKTTPTTPYEERLFYASGMSDLVAIEDCLQTHRLQTHR